VGDVPSLFLCLEDELMRIAAQVELSEAQRKQLETWATGRKSPVRLAERATMILLAAQGKTDKEIAADLGIWRGTVARWRARFIADGLTG
jgi:DNA-binding CsgD family transcriptional regulator